jgi:hypothetical protein
MSYDLSAFKLPPPKEQSAAAQSENRTNAQAKATVSRESDNIWVDEKNRYPNAALAKEGLVQVELPGRPGKDSLGIERPASETMLARNVGTHIVKQIESAFRTSPHEALLTLHHYIGSLKGYKLLDTAQLEKLAHRFASADKPREFFDAEIQPYLQNLTTQKRG